ncbi:MAG TPA: tRNA (adenosine(37)-N6)-threonylcarbamoyltransferase complex dimerization subunit type 1 TsaB [Candidatus Dormibacteraeota bacterium]
MTVLAIDTSSRRRIVCVLAEPGGRPLRSVVLADVDVDLALPRALHEMLAGSPTDVVVVTGPGSYTGIRAGMAAALGVAHGRDLPLRGATSLEVVAAAAAGAGASRGWALVAAGRGAVYAAFFDGDGTGEWSHLPLAAFDARGDAVYSAEELTLRGVQRVDPADGLTRALPAALARPALARDRLRALYPS